MSMNFAINPEKAVEALAYVASARDGLSQKYIAKVFFFAEKWHINAFGRPIVADTYIAMPQGPVPSTIRNLILGQWDWVDKPDNYDSHISVNSKTGLYCVSAKKDASFGRLSKTDKDYLDMAIEYCTKLSSDDLSNLSHSDKAWAETERNRPMNYELFIDDDNENREAVIAAAIESANAAVI